MSMYQLPQHDEKPQLIGGEEPLTQGLQYVASAVKRSSHRECAVSVSIFKPDMTPTGSLCQDWSQCHPADPSFTSQYPTKQQRMEQVVCHARPQRNGDSQCSVVGPLNQLKTNNSDLDINEKCDFSRSASLASVPGWWWASLQGICSPGLTSKMAVIAWWFHGWSNIMVVLTEWWTWMYGWLYVWPEKMPSSFIWASQLIDGSKYMVENWPERCGWPD